MKRKAMISLLLVAAVLFAGMGSALAENEVTLSVETVDAAVDTEVEVSIHLGNAATIDSIQFNLNYDSTALEYVSLMPGRLFPAEYCIANPDVPNCIRVAAATRCGLSEDGVMLTITFKVLAPTGSAITLSDVEISRVTDDYNQDFSNELDFFMLTTDGGVTVGGAALPAPVATPWLAPTPAPTPEPTQEPSAEPTLAPAAEETPMPRQSIFSNRNTTLRYILIAVVVLLVIAIIIVVVSSVQQKKKRRKKKRQQQLAAQRRERERELEREKDYYR